MMRDRSFANDSVLSWTPPSSSVAVKALCWLMALIVALAFYGGASSGAHAMAPFTQMVALVVIPLAVWIWTAQGMKVPVVALVLLGLAVLTPLLQLIPLPVGLWTHLPFRDREVEILQASGIPLRPMPLSLTPSKTLSAFFWMLPPAALFLGVAALDMRQRLWVASVVVLALIGSTLLAALQVSSGYARVFQMYDEVHGLLPIGFFSNRNHQAAALSVGLPLMAAITMIWRRSVKGQWTLPQFLFIGLLALFLVGILITTSRAGLALGAAGVVFSIALYLLASRSGGGLKGQPWWLLAIGVLIVLIVQLAIGAVLVRFEDVSSEGRLWIWPTVMRGVAASFPAGTGLGSFTVVYDAYEPVKNLSQSYVNEAHDEYLQLVLETGLVFPILMAGFLAWVSGRLLATRDATDWAQAALTWAAAGGISILMVASLVDYPLRTTTLGCVFAILCALLTEPQAAAKKAGGGTTGRRRSGRS